MAADPVSPLEAISGDSSRACAHCGHALRSFVDPHVCSSCKKPQPIGADVDYFSVFGLNRRFAVDRKDLETRFYKLSRSLHPDRFTTEGPESQKLSLERMSLVNQAYQTLKDPSLLRGYFLELEGMKGDAGARPTQAGARIPVELAEGWFELQDALMEDPEQAQAKLSVFESELRVLKEKGAREFQELESEIDRAYSATGVAPKAQFEKLARAVQAQSYLHSMERDVERIRARFR